MFILLKPYLLMSRVFLFSFLLLILNCESQDNNILVGQLDNNKHSVQIRLSKNKHKRVIAIKFPKEINIENLGNSNISFKTLDYIYKDSLSKWANRNVSLFKNYNGKLKKVSNFKKKNITSKQSDNYTLYTFHFLDSSKTTQQQFKPYIEKILTEGKDTLYIGTVNDFKKNHKKLFERLTKGDCISIQFLDGKKLGETVTVPVEW